MTFLDKIIKAITSSRLKEIDYFRRNPAEVQNDTLKSLTNLLSPTQYGKLYGVEGGVTYEKFSSSLPVVEYNDIMPYIERHRKGEGNVLVKGTIDWYAKSSGTTASKSKYIPVPKMHLNNCHYRGMKDVVTLLYDSHENVSMMGGRALTLGGSHSIDELGDGHGRYGDLSAILIHNTPLYAALYRLPRKDIALTSNFAEKVEGICRSCVDKNVTSIAGVPSWNLVMLNKVLDYTGKSCIKEVWEDIEIFMHGGVNFKPYREEFNRIMGTNDMKYIESYNASEGFFSIQDDKNSDDMLLMLDYGIFYEFIEMKHINDHSKAIPLADVREGVNYAMLISTLGGLWRYMIGDTVTFTSTSPYKIKITGRTTLYINAFGEEIIIDNAEKALGEACRATDSSINEYTAAPMYMENGGKGAHQWIIEFNKKPNDIVLFKETLDKTLQSINSDYEAKRSDNTTLLPPDIVIVEAGTFMKWMSNRGKVGGQNKVPRLSNNRQYVDSIIELINSNM